ncbi:MAG: DNA polymerase III subunit beta, partial [Thermoleophilaceae bacterium]
MKLSVSRETFLAKLGIAVRGASTRSAIQTLAGVLIRVDDQGAELEATDMELGVRVSLEVKESSRGQAVVPGRLLLDVVRSLPTDDLLLEYRSSQQDVEVVSGPASFHLRTLPSEDFPKLPQRPAEGTMNVPAAAFVDTIGRVARAASRDETRPHLTGVLVNARGQDLRMVATDSYR